jgi:hypothetical protein
VAQNGSGKHDVLGAAIDSDEQQIDGTDRFVEDTAGTGTAIGAGQVGMDIGDEGVPLVGAAVLVKGLQV